MGIYLKFILNFVRIFVLIFCVQTRGMIKIYLKNDCSIDQGKILRYEDIHNNREKIMDLLHDEQFARIIGSPRFSPTMRYEVCVEVNDALCGTEYSLKNKLSLFQCSSHCFHQDKKNAGVTRQKCYCPGERCLDHTQVNCTKEYEGLFNNNSTKLKNNTLKIYSLRADKYEPKNPLYPTKTFKQCLYMYVKNHEETRNTIYQSCSSVNVKGFVCRIRPSHNCTEINEKFVSEKNEAFCIVNKRMSFPQALKYCPLKGGKLSKLPIKAVSKHVDKEALYLLNSFREFQIDYHSNQAGQCIFVRRSKNNLLIETDECIEPTISICSKKIDTTENDHLITTESEMISTKSYSENDDGDENNSSPAKTGFNSATSQTEGSNKEDDDVATTTEGSGLSDITTKSAHNQTQSDINTSTGKEEENGIVVAKTYVLIIGTSVGVILLVAILVMLIKISAVCRSRGQENTHQNAKDETNRQVSYRNRESLAQENDIPQYEGAYSDPNIDPNQPQDSGNDSHYDIIGKSNDDVPNLYNDSNESQNPGSGLHYDFIGQTNESVSNTTAQHSNVYNTACQDSSDYDKLGQHVNVRAGCSESSDVYNHVFSNGNEEYDTCTKRSVQTAGTEQIYNTVS